MPAPAGSGQRYVPGLDGLRAVAVLAVVAYHLGFGWAQGGLLGVGIFFTLSGYLITDLLLGQHAATGRLHLLDFWQRRARRLLPALFVMLGVVAIWVSVFQRAQLSALRGMTAAAAVYISNWWLIIHNQSYFARFGPPSPLGHLWSLAVEEQFYLIWPWLVLLALLVFRHRSERSRRLLMASASLALAAASAIAMDVLYHPGYDPTRVYDGTDTRAFGLLIGAALAILRPSREMPADPSKRSRLALDGTGWVGLVVIGLLIWRTGEYSSFLYRGGMVVLSFATAAVVLAVASPASVLGRALGWGPLRWIGVRSYGIYLWHYPIIVLTTPPNGTDSLPRAAVQVTATIVVAALSWRFIEDPIRHGALKRWLAPLRRSAAPDAARRAWLNLGAGLGAVAVVLVALVGVVPAASAGPYANEANSLLGPGSTNPSGAGAGAQGNGTQGNGKQGKGAQGTTAGGTLGKGATVAPGKTASAPDPLQTSCTSVVHIGDSTSDGLISDDYLPDAADRITAQYHDVGVKHIIYEISGGRSIVETLLGQANAYTVAQGLVHDGYHGCWVLALGTNDTADVAVGSNVGLAQRIQEMMTVTRGMPVMWVNVISLLSSGPYSEHDMQEWNHALLKACAKYPNMRVFNWAAQAQRSWFISDGIHYTSLGYKYRAQAIAGALAQAFPLQSSLDRLPRVAARMLAQQADSGCVVN
jgi:peptidoglycan/LPS O-acetylase OafA/YrhL